MAPDLRPDFPRVACVKELREVAGSALRLYVANLVGNHVFVARDIAPRAQHADRSGESGAEFHLRKQEGVRRARIVLVVDEQIFFGDAVPQRDDFELEAVQANAFVAILAEDERLSVLELDDVLAARILFRDCLPGVIVKDIAVLQNFDVG